VNLPYDDHLDGEWNYIYYSYKRTGDTGVAKAFILFSVTNQVKVGVNNGV